METNRNLKICFDLYIYGGAFIKTVEKIIEFSVPWENDDYGKKDIQEAFRILDIECSKDLNLSGKQREISYWTWIHD